MDYVSCAPALLYSEGGFFDPTELLSLLSNQKDDDQYSIIREVYSSYSYLRQLPDLFASDASLTQQIDQHYRDCLRMFKTGAASYLISLRSGYLRNNVVSLGSESNVKTLYETHRPNDRPYNQLLTREHIDSPERNLLDTSVVNFYLGSVGSSNYGHWLVDDLPRAYAVELLRREMPERVIRVYITAASPAMDQVRRDSLLALLPDKTNLDVRVLRRDRTYAFKDLFYATPVTYHPTLKSPRALHYVQDRLRSKIPGSDRLFVKRSKKFSRHIANNDEIEQHLTDLGFHSIDVEQMNFRQQVDAFSGARVVVGCMGAAMTNCLFADADAVTIYLVPEGWVEPFYWDMASTISQRYVACFGPMINPAVPPHVGAFRLDPILLRRVVAQYCQV